MPGPPLVSTLGRSTILNASITRISMTRDRDRQDRRPGDVAEHLPAAGAVDQGGLDLVLRLALERGQQHDEHERDPLPGVADHDGEPRAPGVGQPRRSLAQPEPLPERRERPLGGVGQHAEGVGDADRRDHHRAGRTRRGRSVRPGRFCAHRSASPRPMQILHGDADADVEQGDAEACRAGRRRCWSSTNSRARRTGPPRVTSRARSGPAARSRAAQA